MILNENVFAPNIETTDENLSLPEIYMKMRFPSVGKEIFTNAPVHGPTGAIFAIRGKASKDGYELLRSEVEVFPDMLEKKVEISKEVVEDLQSMFGLDGLKLLAAYLAGFAKEEENDKTLAFLETNCESRPNLTLSEPQNPETTWKEISYKAHQLVLEANMTGKMTYNAFVLLPYKYAASIMSDFADLHNSKEANIDEAFVGNSGNLKFFINPNPEADTAYVGLTHPFDTGKSCATFSEYFNEIREALDPKSGRIKYFIYSKFALTKNPLHTANTPLMFKFKIN